MLALIEKGHGQPGFFLTKKIVDGYVYKLCRNPMSLGFYSGCLALGFIAGSTYFTFWVLIEVIPSHILYLKIFEELELKLRFGQSYIEYKKHTPFLIPNFRKIVVKKSLKSNA
jgi:protein-S-isoprenylcysteine O-methyltransferase Ste14